MAGHHLGNNRINALFRPGTLLFSQSKLLKKYVFGTFYICFDKKPGVLCVGFGLCFFFIFQSIRCSIFRQISMEKGTQFYKQRVYPF